MVTLWSLWFHLPRKLLTLRRSVSTKRVDSTRQVAVIRGYKTNPDVRSALMETKGVGKGSPVSATVTGRVRSDGRIHAETIAVQEDRSSTSLRSSVLLIAKPMFESRGLLGRHLRHGFV